MISARFLCLGLLPIAAWAQVSAPTLGFLPDRGRLLPVNGVPAAALIAPPLDFGGDFDRIAVSPRQDFALVSLEGSGTVAVAHPDGTTTAVTGASARPDGIFLSPSGTGAALWFGASRSIEILAGLPSVPTVRQINVTFLSGGPSGSPLDAPAMAVSDDGAWAAGAWATGVWGFGPSGEVRSLMASDGVSAAGDFALAFYAGREDLAVATRTGVYSISNVGGSAATSTLYTAESSLAPVGLAVTSDNSTLVMADKKGAVLVIHAGASHFDCGCVPEGVFPMGGSVFRISGLTGAAFRIFDIKAGSIFLVPLAPGTYGPASPRSAAGPRSASGGTR